MAASPSRLTHLAPFVDVSRAEDPPRRARRRSRTLGVETPDEADFNKVVEDRLRDEIRRGVQTIQYQVVTLMTTNGQAPFVTVFMYLGEARQRAGEARPGHHHRRGAASSAIEGVKNEKGVWITPAFPKLIYVLEEDNIHRGRAVLLSDEAGRQAARPSAWCRITSPRRRCAS